MDMKIVNCVDCGKPFYWSKLNKYNQCYHCWSDDIDRIFD